MINRNDFPILNSLMWDVKGTYIDYLDALHLYEKRSSYYKREDMNERELGLLNHLIDLVGNGIFLGL